MIRDIPKRYWYNLGHANDSLFKVMCIIVYIIEDMYVAHSVYLHSISRKYAIYLSCVLFSSVYSLQPSCIVLIDVTVPFSFRPICSSIGVYHSDFPVRLLFPIGIIYPFPFSIGFLPQYVSFQSIFSTVLCNELGKYAKNLGLYNHAGVVLYGGQDG